MIKFKKTFFIVSSLALLASGSVFADDVKLINVTGCHVLPDGSHEKTGQSTYVGIFDANLVELESIAPHTSGKAPIINDNGQQTINVSYDDGENIWSVVYAAGDAYIVGYEGSTPGCTFSTSWHPCLILSTNNPCT
jgi:hypothetical protein